MKKNVKRFWIGVIIPPLLVVPFLLLSLNEEVAVSVNDYSNMDYIMPSDLNDNKDNEVINESNKKKNEELQNETKEENNTNEDTKEEIIKEEVEPNNVIESVINKTDNKEVRIVTFNIVKSTNDLTNKNVTLTVNTDSNNLVSFNNNSYSSTKTFSISTNGIYNVKVKNNSGQIKEETVTITNIDKEKPTLNYTLNTTSITTNPVIITLSSSDNVSLPNNKYSYNNGEFTSNQNYTFTTNVSNFSIRVKDSAGNITEKLITINNIKKEEILKEKTTKEKNTEIISQIRSTYGFDIEYGEGTYFWFGGEPSVILTDEEKVLNILNRLKKSLSLFPSGFFYMFQGKNGYSVLLVDDIPGDVAGVATSEMPGSNQLVLDVNAGFLERTFYHETFHLIDYLIEYMYYESNNPFDNWNSLNNPTFTYNGSDYNDNTLTIYDSTITNSEKRFITSYGKKSEREDRAEIFADLMFRPYKQFYMNSEYGVYQKALYLTNVLNSIWNNSSNAGWNRWVNG